MLCDNCRKREANVRYSENVAKNWELVIWILVCQLIFLVF